MNNIFPLQENVCIEEVYGHKRTNASPPINSKTAILKGTEFRPNFLYYESIKHHWLSKEEVSEFERNAFPFLETIKNNKPGHGDDDRQIKKYITDEEYLRIRNAIIDEYEKDYKFLSLSSAYSLVKGSFNVVSRIFSFLERQKIINKRNVLKECKIMMEELIKAKEDDLHQMDLKKDTKDNKNNLSIEVRENENNFHCLCNKKASFYTKDDQFICNDCYDRGLYKENLTSSDFFRLNESVMKKSWSKKEEIKLLEAVDKFGDDWKRVSTHVETKNVYECILYFINMAIQEKNLANQNFSIRIPFVKTPNPVMYLITFICSVVHPTLGSVAAHEAMLEIENSSVNVIKSILLKVKEKAKELIDFETKKIERTDLVIEEAMVNLINLKTKTYKDLSLSENKVRQELIDLRNRMLEEDFE